MTAVNARQRGMTVPMVALMIVTLFVFAALAVDIGVFMTARTSAQHAADAAALAGAWTFMNPAATQPDAAVNAAITVAAQNSILGTPVTIGASNVVVDTAARTVKVTVPRTGANGIPTYFARVIQPSVDVETIAEAEADSLGSSSRCLKPIFLPNTVLSQNPPATACSQGQVMFDSNGNLTTWAQSKLGQPMNIRPSNPQNALQPSQFYSLDFGSGANTYRCTLGQCLNECAVSTSSVSCGSSYPVETGNMVGPTVQGVTDLIGSPPDTWVGIGEYQDPSGVITDSSRSVAIAPVWDNCAQNISPGYHGQAVKVIGFAEIFVDGMQGSNVVAHMISPIACSAAGGGGSGPSGGNTGPLGVPVRLIQVQQ